MIKKIQLILFTYMFLLCTSQTKTPESYRIIRGVNENINYYSGTLDLNVPLFTVEEGNFKFANTLNYESRGFVPHITPSNVGLNWNMMPFGKITRESKRIDFTTTSNGILFFLSMYDDDDMNYENPQNYLRNDCITAGFGPINGVKSHKKDIFNNPFGKDYYAGISFTNNSFVSKSYNYEPDKYYFDFLGYKGYFVVDNEGKVIVFCENASLLVEINNYGCHDLFGNITFSEFTIFDDKGNKYVFGGTPDALDINYSYNRVLLQDGAYYFPWGSEVNRSNRTNYIDSWLLKKVILANGQIVSAHYKGSNINVLNNYRNSANYTPGYFFQNLSIDGELYMDDNTGFPDKQTLKNNNLVINHTRTFSDIFKSTFGWHTSALIHKQIDTYTKRSILDSITTNNLTVSYGYLDTNNPLELTNNYLNKIKIKYKNKLIKEINLLYEDLGNNHKRTFLKTVNNSTQENVNFEYYNTNEFPEYKNSYYTTNDLGYWNGTMNTNFQNYFFQGIPDNLSKYDVGLLKKVTYATEGSTNFFYENGDYSKIYKYNDDYDPTYLGLFNISRSVNAPRLSKKVDVGLDFSSIETTYSYKNEDNSSSGIIDGTLVYIPSINDGTYQGSTFTRKNSSENLLTQNSLHYSSVKVINQGKGFTRYTFTDRVTNPDTLTLRVTKTPTYKNQQHEDICNQNPFQDKDRLFLSKQYERGKILKEENFNDNNIKLKEITYKYKNFLNKFPALDYIEGCTNCKVSDLNYYVKTMKYGDKCYLQTMYVPVIPYLQSKKTTKQYFVDKIVETRHEISYSDRVYAISRKFWHPYPIEEKIYTGSGSTIKKYLYASELYKDLNVNPVDDDNVVGSQQDSYRTMITNNVFTPLVEITKNTNDKYSLKENLFYSYPYLKRKSRNSVLGTNLDFTNFMISSVNMVDDIKYEKFDNRFNYTQIKDKADVPSTILYGYNQTLPILKIEGIGYVELMQLLSLPTGASDYLNLDVVVASNVDASQGTNSTEEALLQKLDDFRKIPALSSYQITTYTYDPLIGIRSITPPSGIRESYIYDVANRLEKIIDINGNIVKEYKYHYAPHRFLNKLIDNKTYTKNDCPSGMISSSLNYSVPAAKYTSLVSQAEADQQAENEAQNYANANLTCYYPYCTLNTQSSSNYIMMQYAPFEKVNTTVNAQLHFQVTSSQGLDWSNQVILGNLESLCWPSSTITRTSGNWQITIYPASGQTTLRWIGSGGPAVGGYYSVSFSYNIN